MELEAQSDGVSWPTAAVKLLGEAGCWRNVVAVEFGGSAATPQQQLETYQAVAWGSLSLALILTQNDAACELLSDCDNTELAQRLLPRCARGELLLTVGISQLTTSRRSVGPAMKAEIDGDLKADSSRGYRLSGFMPWVTSAPHADYIVTGAVLPDGMQILVAVPTDANGLSVSEPMRLMALGSSWTCEVRCQGVHIEAGQLMRGPAERVLAIRAPVKPLSVSAVGLGAAERLLYEVRALAKTVDQVPALLDEKIVPRFESIRRRLYDAADTLSDPSKELPAMDIRVAVNDLVVRLACTLMTLSKGSGYLLSHQTQRLAREAMFFLVWSAPPHVQAGTLEHLWA
ncbi:MAG: acyl-CoA/acyl-ACP dehydrogenase [Armatimonadetes bacterium]|nr:acyl-CoA/acyl-ACP dehydrogenase [Armatimonadota bacterium]